MRYGLRIQGRGGIGYTNYGYKVYGQLAAVRTLFYIIERYP